METIRVICGIVMAIYTAGFGITGWMIIHDKKYYEIEGERWAIALATTVACMKWPILVIEAIVILMKKREIK